MLIAAKPLTPASSLVPLIFRSTNSSRLYITLFLFKDFIAMMLEIVSARNPEVCPLTNEFSVKYEFNRLSDCVMVSDFVARQLNKRGGECASPNL